MNLQYRIVESKNPGEEKFYYSVLVKREVFTMEKLCRRISMSSTFTEADILGVTSAFLEHIPDALLEGNTVKLLDFGTFWLTLRNRKTTNNRKLEKENIIQLKLNFRPSTRLKNKLKIASFELATEELIRKLEALDKAREEKRKQIKKNI